jgi:hypothetical protein
MIVRVAFAASRPQRDARPASGRAYLKARAAAQAVPELEPLRAAVRRWVKSERVERHGGIASVYHLVPRGSVAAYRRAMTAAAHAAGVRMVVTGPFAPYAFASAI